MFDQTKADNAVKFIKSLKHTKGEWAGRSFNLLGWEEKIIRDLFGTVNEDGTRQYREAYISTGRKSGKTEIASAIALYCLYADGENGAEVYCNAGDRDQASIVFDAARIMVEQSPTLSKHSKILPSTKRIVYHKRNSFLRALSHEAQTKHGYNVHVSINDEVHVWPNRDLYNVMKTGTGARTQPLIVNITTAGFDRNSLCWELYQYAKKVRDGIIDDSTFYVAIFEVEENEDWTDESVWYKANPGLGVYRSLQEMRDKFKRAKEIPSEENEFRNLYLNQWTQQLVRFIPMDKWDECDQEFSFEDMKGKTCFIGLDLASSVDIAAVIVVFPVEDNFVNVQSYFFVPGENIKKRSERDRVPYDVWARQKYIIATPGNVIDYSYIEDKIKEIAESHEMKALVYDRWGAVQISQRLQEVGINVVPMGQGYASMSAPTKEFLNFILKGKVRHGNNPVLRWMANNLTIKKDAAGNIKPDKEKSTEKIDGIVALIMAIDPLIREGLGVSVYDERGIIFLEEPPKQEKEEEITPEEQTIQNITGLGEKCPRCGFTIPDNAEACLSCGRLKQKCEIQLNM